MTLVSIGAGVGIASGLYSVGSGIYKSHQAKKALKNLAGQPMPEYSLSPELSNAYQTAQKNAQQGFSGQETAAFQSNLAQNNNQQYQRALQQGGGSLASAIGAGVNYGNINAMNQFAGQDAQLKRQNQQQVYGLAGQLQQQQNLGTQLQAQRRMQLEQAYGGAMSDSLGQIGQGIGQIGAIGTAYAGGSMRKQPYGQQDYLMSDPQTQMLSGSQYGGGNIPNLQSQYPIQ